MMESKARIIKRYSLSFKQKVVKEIEDGKLSISEAQKLYSIGGAITIQCWIKKLGKNELLNKVVRIELKDEVNKLKAIEKQNHELESALARAHLKILSLEKMLEIAGRDYGEDFKKKYDKEASKK
jgi:transposase-like protein